MLFGDARLHSLHLSNAKHCRDKAAECTECAKRTGLPDLEGVYKNLARQWLELAKKAEANAVRLSAQDRTCEHDGYPERD
jgi:hypothetical protein